MFNVTVIKMKDIKKFLIGMVITVLVVIIGSNYFSTIAEKSKNVQKSFFQNSMIECLESTVPTVGVVNEEKDIFQKEINKIQQESALQGVLNTQISSIKTLQKSKENIEKTENKDTNETEANQEEKETTEEKSKETTRKRITRDCYEDTGNNK